jgi:hypothetical protein
MTVLVGQQGSGWTIASAGDWLANSTAMGYYNGVGYLGLATGVVTTVSVGFGTTAPGTYQVCIYSGAGPGATLLGTSNSFSGVANTVVTASMPGTVNIVSGSAYMLILSLSGSSSGGVQINSGSSAFVGYRMSAANFPFATPPGTLPADTDGTNHEFLIYASGSSGPTAYTVVGQPGYYNYSGGATTFGNNTQYMVSGAVGSYFYQGFPATILKNGIPFNSGGGYGKGRRRFHRYT